MIELNGCMGLAPRTFKTDPKSYVKRLHNSVCREPRGALVLVVSQVAYEHLANWCEHFNPITAALMFQCGVLAIDRVPVTWNPSVPNDEVRMYEVCDDGPKLVGMITDISL